LADVCSQDVLQDERQRELRPSFGEQTQKGVKLAAVTPFSVCSPSELSAVFFRKNLEVGVGHLG
jgi:hypothetical protein